MIKIRALTKKDNFEDLIRLSIQFFKEYEDHEKKYFKIDKLNTENINLFFEEILNSKTSISYVAVDHKKIVGYITLSVKLRPSFYKLKKVGYISGLMVDKNYRNQGIATELLNIAKIWFDKNDIQYIYLETSSNNTNAIDFYKKNKFDFLRVQLYSKI